MRNRKEGFWPAAITASISAGLMVSILIMIGAEGEVQQNRPATRIPLHFYHDPALGKTKIVPEKIPAFQTLIAEVPVAPMGEMPIPGRSDLIYFFMPFAGPGSDTTDNSVESLTYSAPTTLHMIRFLLKDISSEMIPCNIDPTSQDVELEENNYVLEEIISLTCE
jgi:hypothetical protein